MEEKHDLSDLTDSFLSYWKVVSDCCYLKEDNRHPMKLTFCKEELESHATGTAH